MVDSIYYKVNNSKKASLEIPRSCHQRTSGGVNKSAAISSSSEAILPDALSASMT